MANSFKRAVKNTITNTAFATGAQAALDVYTQSLGASSAAVVHALYISNVSGASTTVDIGLDAAGTVYHIGKGIPVPSGSTMFFDRPINLENGDRLKVRCPDGASIIEVVGAILEVV